MFCRNISCIYIYIYCDILEGGTWQNTNETLLIWWNSSLGKDTDPTARYWSLPADQSGLHLREREVGDYKWQADGFEALPKITSENRRNLILSRWWFKNMCNFQPYRGNDPCWLNIIFFFSNGRLNHQLDWFASQAERLLDRAKRELWQEGSTSCLGENGSLQSSSVTEDPLETLAKMEGDRTQSKMGFHDPTSLRGFVSVFQKFSKTWKLPEVTMGDWWWPSFFFTYPWGDRSWRNKSESFLANFYPILILFCWKFVIWRHGCFQE